MLQCSPRTITIRHLMILKLHRHYNYIHQPQDVLKLWEDMKIDSRNNMLSSHSPFFLVKHDIITNK